MEIKNEYLSNNICISTTEKPHYKSLEKTIISLENALKNYSGSRQRKLTMLIRNNFYLRESILYYAEMSHFPKNIKNLKIAIEILYKKAQENNIPLNDASAILIFMGLKKPEDRKEKVINEILAFYKKYGRLSYTLLVENGEENLYNRICKYFPKRKAKDKVCDICLKYLKNHGYIRN